MIYSSSNARQTDQDSRSAGSRAVISVTGMTSIETITLEVADPAAATRFYSAAFGPDTPVRVRASQAPTIVSAVSRCR
jgi:hypothetical protein